jgi:hypothetical protein
VFGAAEKYAGIEEALVDAHQKAMMECTNAFIKLFISYDYVE